MIAAGETECWRFAGASGDRVRLRLVTPSVALAPRAEVVRPDGATVCAASGNTNQTCVLDASGTHTVLVRVAGAYAGGYSLSIQRLADPVGCSAKPFGTAAERGVVTLTGETDCWRFEGVPGQPVRLTTVRTAGTLSPAVEVLRPNGTTRCGPSPADELTCRPDVRGTHTILLRDGQGPQLGEYRLGLQRLVDPVGCAALAYGTNVTVAALATTGETGCWRFTGGAGDRLRLRAVGTSGALIPIAEVLDGLGSTTCAPAHDCRLDASGAHTILLRDSLGTRTGAYRISIQRLNNPVGCEDEPGSDGVGGSIDAAGLGCWRLDGDAGDLVRRRVIDTGPGLDPVTEVVRPDGTTVCSPSTHDSETCELDADGAHAILVQGASGASSGEYRIATIQLNDPFYSCANLATSPSAHSASIAGAAEVDCYTTWAPEAGMRSLRVEATSGTLQPVVEILKPDGALRCRTTAPDGWFDCYGDIYEYSRILVYDVSGLGRGNYEIDRR